MNIDALQPGIRVRVTHTVRRTGADWNSSVTGEVLSCAEEDTGSWFAHGPRGKVVLRRLRLRKDDGELTTLTLDQRSLVEVLQPIREK